MTFGSFSTKNLLLDAKVFKNRCCVGGGPAPVPWELNATLLFFSTTIGLFLFKKIKGVAKMFSK